MFGDNNSTEVNNTNSIDIDYTYKEPGLYQAQCYAIDNNGSKTISVQDVNNAYNIDVQVIQHEYGQTYKIVDNTDWQKIKKYCKRITNSYTSYGAFIKADIIGNRFKFKGTQYKQVDTILPGEESKVFEGNTTVTIDVEYECYHDGEEKSFSKKLYFSNPVILPYDKKFKIIGHTSKDIFRNKSFNNSNFFEQIIHDEYERETNLFLMLNNNLLYEVGESADYYTLYNVADIDNITSTFDEDNKSAILHNMPELSIGCKNDFTRIKKHSLDYAIKLDKFIGEHRPNICRKPLALNNSYYVAILDSDYSDTHNKINVFDVSNENNFTLVYKNESFKNPRDLIETYYKNLKFATYYDDAEYSQLGFFYVGNYYGGHGKTNQIDIDSRYIYYLDPYGTLVLIDYTKPLDSKYSNYKVVKIEGLKNEGWDGVIKAPGKIYLIKDNNVTILSDGTPLIDFNISKTTMKEDEQVELNVTVPEDLNISKIELYEKYNNIKLADLKSGVNNISFNNYGFKKIYIKVVTDNNETYDSESKIIYVNKIPKPKINSLMINDIKYSIVDDNRYEYIDSSGERISSETSTPKFISTNIALENDKDINFTCNATEPDNTLRYKINILSSDVNETYESNDGNFIFSENTVGDYNITCQAINEYDNTDTYTISFKIKEPNQLPIIGSFDANDSIGVVPFSVSFTSKDISDTDGSIDSVKLDCGNGNIKDFWDDYGVRRGTCNYNKEGDYNATVIVKDNEGAISKKSIPIKAVKKDIISLKEEYSSNEDIKDVDVSGNTIAITTEYYTSLYSTQNLPILNRESFFHWEPTGDNDGKIVVNEWDRGEYFYGSKIINDIIYQKNKYGFMSADINDLKNPKFIAKYYYDAKYIADILGINNSKILVATNGALHLTDVTNKQDISSKSIKCSKLKKVSNRIVGICSNKLFEISIENNNILTKDITNSFTESLNSSEEEDSSGTIEIRDIDVINNHLAVVLSYTTQCCEETQTKNILEIADMTNQIELLSSKEIDSDINKINYANMNLILGYNNEKMSTFRIYNNQIVKTSSDDIGAIDLEVVSNNIITVQQNSIKVYLLSN